MSDVKDFSIKNVNCQLEKLQQLEKERDVRQKAVNSCNNRLQKINAEIEINENELKTLHKEGVEVKAQADEIKAELTGIFGENCTDYNIIMKLNDDNLEVFKRQKENLSTKIEKAKNNKAEIAVLL